MGKNTSYGEFNAYYSPISRYEDDYKNILDSYQTDVWKKLDHDNELTDKQKKNFDSTKKKDARDDYLALKFQSARNKGKSISLFGTLFRKRHTNIGRFGQKTISKEDDTGNVFGALDRNKASVKYFDPFQKMGNTREPNEGEDDRTGDLKNSFRQRTRKNEQLVSESDFERSQLTDDAKKYAFVDWAHKKGYDDNDVLVADDNAKSGMAQVFAAQYDNSKAFKPDYEKKDQMYEPNQFEVVVAAQPPTDVYIDYHKQVTKETNFVFKFLKPDYRKILDENMKKSAAYAELVAKGKKEAEEVNTKYNPNMDPNIGLLRAQMMENIEQGQGHSFVRMVAKRDGETCSSYSFGFWPLTTTPGMGGVTMGVVKNPDPDASDQSIIEHPFEVKYVDYLRAAAKIRGVVGSQRSYSFLGYNCTSFAADIAKEAGVAIKDDDSSEKLRTFKYKSARIDSPYSLAKFIRRKNEEQSEKKDGAKEPSQTEVPEEVKAKVKDMSFLEQTDRNILSAIMDISNIEMKNPEKGGLVLNAEYDKKGRVGRSYLTAALQLEVYNDLLESLRQNPLLIKLKNRFAPDKKSDPQKKESDVYASQLFQTILSSTVDAVNMIDEKVNNEISYYKPEKNMTDIAEPYDLSGLDRQASIRKLKIARKRDWMKQTFGYVTTTEYLSAVVKKPEMLAKAIMRLKEYPISVKTELNLGDDRIFQFLQHSLLPATGLDVPSRDTMRTWISQNSYFQKRPWLDMMMNQFGMSTIELVLEAILETSQQYSVKKQFATEEDYDQLSDQEKVEAMISHQGETAGEFIWSACKDEKKLETLIEEGLLTYRGFCVRDLIKG